MGREQVYLFDWADRHTREKIADLVYVRNAKFKYTDARIYEREQGISSAITIRVFLSGDTLKAVLPENLGGSELEWHFPDIPEQIALAGY